MTHNVTTTIENDHGCGVSSCEYSAQYCPDQNNLMIDIAKPSSERMVLERQLLRTKRQLPRAAAEVGAQVFKISLADLILGRCTQSLQTP